MGFGLSVDCLLYNYLYLLEYWLPSLPVWYESFSVLRRDLCLIYNKEICSILIEQQRKNYSRRNEGDFMEHLINFTMYLVVFSNWLLTSSKPLNTAKYCLLSKIYTLLATFDADLCCIWLLSTCLLFAKNCYHNTHKYTSTAVCIRGMGECISRLL